MPPSRPGEVVVVVVGRVVVVVVLVGVETVPVTEPVEVDPPVLAVPVLVDTVGLVPVGAGGVDVGSGVVDGAGAATTGLKGAAVEVVPPGLGVP
jgi:hypothetical protein